MINNTKTKEITYKVKVLGEGDTECNYIEGLKKVCKTKFTFEAVDMHGGGYTEFIKKVNAVSYLNCIAIFIIIDLDKAESDKVNLEKLINLCNGKAKLTKIPYILIGNNADFEYFACSHCETYSNGDTSQHIIKQLEYKSVKDFKADTAIFNVLNNELRKRSYIIAMEKSKGKYIAGNTYFKYNYIPIIKGINIKFNICKPVINKDALVAKHSNFIEFFKIIGL